MNGSDTPSRKPGEHHGPTGQADRYMKQRQKTQAPSSFERAFGFLSKVPWEKISIWTIFLFLFWTLRDFFTLILLTFVFSYITNSIVSSFSKRLKVDRRSLTVLIYVLFLGLFLGPGQWFANRVVVQGRPLAQDAAAFIRQLGQDQAEKTPSPQTPSNQQKSTNDKQSPDDVSSSGERPADTTPPGTDPSDKSRTADQTTNPERDQSDEANDVTWRLRELDYRLQALNKEIAHLQKESERESRTGTGTTERSLQRTEDVPDHIRTFVNDILRKNIGDEWLNWVQNRGLYDYFLVEVYQIWKNGIPHITQYANIILVNIGNFLFTFLLAILFSFLIVFDIPNLKERLSQFEEGRLSDFYLEIAPSLANFGTVMGRTLQAQAMIAVVNTVLTISGIYMMSLATGIDFIKYLAVLTIIVFVCSFVPVLGVIISTVPIGLIALVKGGIWALVGIIVLILVIHAVETYILNPNIYGVHLRMHPLVVLIVLLVAEHFFGLWGLVLGVPVSVYLLDIVIQQTTPEELFYQRAE